MTRNAKAFSVVIINALEAFAVAPATAVQPCPDTTSCAQVVVDKVSAMPEETVEVGITFQQGPDDDREGGIDAIAALAMTISFAGGALNNALALADCSADTSGLPKSVHTDPAISAFTVAIQNAYCTAGRPHCLCPDPLSGITPDSFVNIAIFTPRDPFPITPLPITTLPNGHLLSIDLHLGETADNAIPLHVYSLWTDAQHPPSTAMVSVGDTLRVDQTCVPQTGSIPCGGAGAVSQLTVTDGEVSVILPPTATDTAMSTPTPTASETPTPTATSPPTASPTGTPSASPTSVPSDTATPTPTQTGTPSGTMTNTATPTSSQTATASNPPSGTATVTSSTTPTAGPPLASPTATPLLPTATDTPALITSPTPGQLCQGDCNADGTVTVDEILIMVNIALGNVGVSACPAGDLNHDGHITVDEIAATITHALNGC